MDSNCDAIAVVPPESCDGNPTAPCDGNSAGNSLPEMRREVAVVSWYDAHRPHQALGGRTPAERRDGVEGKRRVVFETRARMPLARDGPRRTRCKKLELIVDSVGGHAHLPIVSVRRAA